MYSKVIVRVFLSIVMFSCCVGCGGGSSTLTGSAPSGAPQAVAPDQHNTIWPAGLPVDALQPWEELDVNGKVSAGLNGSSEFLSGVERFRDSLAGVSDNGETAHLASGDAGSGTVAWVLYRVLMGGMQPGVASLDVNLGEMSDGNLSSYYVALSDYGAGRWEWCGPFSDSHVRLSMGAAVAAGGDYLSDLGNHFICVVAFDGAVCDVVGVSTNAYDAADTDAPPSPTGLNAMPVHGGLDLQWNSVLAADLAGYRVYHSAAAFAAPDEAGVRQVDYLIGQLSHLLTGLDATTHVRVSAVDFSGNESTLSAAVSATPQAGHGPDLRLSTGAASGLINDGITLTATGATNYAWDLDGNGIFEVTGDTTGIRSANTSRTGIIRPSVRGTTSDGLCVSCAAVSLIIAGNSRPVANAYASPTSGTAPLPVTLTGAGEDDDGTLVSYSWDFDGDGVYDEDWTINPGPVEHTYTAPGLYNAKFRVEDDLGSWDVDTVSILVSSSPDPANNPPVADLIIGAGEASGNVPHSVHFDASGSSDPDGAGDIVRYWWDLDGDGMYEGTTDTATFNHTYTVPGIFTAKVKVEDADGDSSTDTVEITVNVAGNDLPVADLTSNVSSGDVPLAVHFDATGSSDSDGTIVLYEWDYERDGIYDGYGTVPTADHAYTTPGIFNCRVRVTDDAGAQATDFVEITVSVPGNNQPVAVLTVDQDRPLTGRMVTFDASGSTAGGDPGDSIVLYEWDFNGDGAWDASGASATAAHAYTVQYGYNALVRVTDEAGAQDTAGVQVAATHTPWSAQGHDTLSSRRSPYTGAQTDNVKWSYTTGGRVTSSPAIGADGTVYVGNWDNKLYALNPNGTLRWSYTTGNRVESSPAIGADGTVYLGSWDNKLYAINPDGTLRWSYTTGGIVYSSPVIGSDGTVYVGSYDDKLYALNPDGTLKWSYSTGNDVRSSPAIGADGTVYVGSLDYKLYAINPDGGLKWSYTTGSLVASSPAIGADGTVYVGSNDNKLYALNPDGTLRWSYTTGGIVYSSPAIGTDGTVYVGSYDGKLYALNPDGTLQWSYTTAALVYSSPAIGADGTVYVGSNDSKLYALNPDGTLKWSYATGSAVYSSPAIGADGTVYVGGYDNKLYAFGPTP